MDFDSQGKIIVPIKETPYEEIDIKSVRKISENILYDFKSGTGILSKYYFPKDLTLPTGMDKGSEDHLRYMTIIVTFSFIRDAIKLHELTRNIFLDPNTR